MAKRDHARGRAADFVEPTVSLESCERLLSLIDEGRHGALLADLSRLRAGCVDTGDPFIRNMLASLHHLGMAWGCCLRGDEPDDRGDRRSERDRILRRQLRSLCCLTLELTERERLVPAAEGAYKPAAGRSLTAFVGSLLSAFGGQVTASPKQPVIAGVIDPEAGSLDVDAGDDALAFDDRNDAKACADVPGSMSVYFFGTFRVCLDGAFVEEWRNAKSKLVLKYLIAHKERAITKDYLMELFWPNTEPECARNNLISLSS